MLRGDLHFHSLYSDGELSPLELAKRVKEKRIDIACLTDHDAVLGTKEFIEACQEFSIISFPALELSTYKNGEPIHVLAYFKSFDAIGKEFLKYLDEVKIQRYERMKKLVENVNKIYNLGIDFKDVEILQPNMLERPHLAKIISEKHNISMKQVYEKYLGNDNVAFIPSTKLPTEDGIRMIHEAGGIAILAHPYQYRKNNFVDLMELDFDGVEVYYFPASKKLYKPIKKYCTKHNLIITGGSDFHRELDIKHSYIGSGEFTSPFIEKFIERINSL
ncbi:PHP domain-containing protein [bacterium]|nr:PHP domain-containing protein [bacterium]